MAGLGKLKEVKGIRGAVYRLGKLQTRTAFVGESIANSLRFGMRRNGSHPAITEVVVGRNDDYMADFRERLIATIDWNTRYLIDEVIFVEWNPPADRDLLAYELTKKFPQVRAYVVAPEIHRALSLNPNLQVLEYHAKNVGIRRVETPWVLTTNADAVLAMNTINRILDTRLDPKVIWTAQRVDINWDENVQSSLGFFGSLRCHRFIDYDRMGTGEFALVHRDRWHEARGYDESLLKHKIGCDVRGIAQLVAHGAQIQRAGTVLHLRHPTSCVESLQPFRGEWAPVEGVPYQNDENWGLGNSHAEQLAERVWRLTVPGLGENGSN